MLTSEPGHDEPTVGAVALGVWMVEQALPRTVRDPEFLAMCHDLRQFVIAGRLLTDIPDGTELPHDVLERMTLLRDNFEHAGALLDSVLDGRAEQERVELTSLVAEQVGLVRPRHPVSSKSDGAPVWALCSPVLVRRALSNLLDNAIRAAGEDGTVLVRLGSARGAPYVEVRDDGPGFGQLTPAAGMGLTVVSWAARQCGARLTIDSGPKPGTTVRLTLRAG